ncbi:hypothetical protein [Amycolatopsis sp. NPDC051061]|uniref:hypothetical protein n=1 Tax=Amycolatopsis sp. NPDC051061 TaxID=3155042 RepID=UPI00342640D4
MSDDVGWPDGANRLPGRAVVKTYWPNQWTHTRTHDRPPAFTPLPGGRVTVRISQVVRSDSERDAGPPSRGIRQGIPLVLQRQSGGVW